MDKPQISFEGQQTLFGQLGEVFVSVSIEPTTQALIVDVSSSITGRHLTESINILSLRSMPVQNEARQIFETSNSMEANIHNLPPEILEKIFMLLPPSDLMHLDHVCKDWFSLCSGHSNPRLWKRIFQRDIGSPPFLMSFTWKERYRYCYLRGQTDSFMPRAALLPWMAYNGFHMRGISENGATGSDGQPVVTYQQMRQLAEQGDHAAAAAFGGHLEIMANILDQLTSEWKRSAVLSSFREAVKIGDTRICKYLMDKNLIDTKDITATWNCESALSIATQFGYRKLVDILLPHFVIGPGFEQRRSRAFYWAVRRGWADVARRLAEAPEGVNVNYRCVAESPLMAAVDRQDRPMVSFLLSQRGIDLELVYNGYTALTQALALRDEELVLQLLCAGAQVDKYVFEPKGTTLLMECVRARLTRVVRMLLKVEGVARRLAARDIAGRTAVHYACKRGDLGMLRVLLSEEVVPERDDVTFLLNQEDNRGRGPMKLVEKKAMKTKGSVSGELLEYLRDAQRRGQRLQPSSSSRTEQVTRPTFK